VRQPLLSPLRHRSGGSPGRELPPEGTLHRAETAL